MENHRDLGHLNKSVKADGRLRLIYSGSDYFDALEGLIQSAQHTIHLQTYIFEEDETGKRIAQALMDAAKRGVEVFMLVDGYGSQGLSQEFVAKLSLSGIHFRFFSPFFSFQNIYIGRRLHHKVVVVDAQRSLIGGINIADKYRGTETGPPWLDYAVLLKGNICEAVQNICERVYNKKFKRKGFKKSLQIENGDADFSVNIRQNDRLRKRKDICESYLRAIVNAKNTVHIVGSYFLPGKKLRNAITRAAQRGVEVHIVLAGISDVPMFQSATAHLYEMLLKNKVNVHEYNKSVLHGKVAAIDNQWATIGSFNLNYLSAYGSVELNVDINNAPFATALKKHLEEVIATDCDPIRAENQNHDWAVKIKRWAAYQIVRTGLKIVALFPNYHPFKNLE